MSLEEALAKNTAALEANTAALLKAGAATGSTKSTTTADTKKEVAKPKHTREEMEAALRALREKLADEGAASKAIIKDTGKADKMKDIADALIDAVYDEAKKQTEAAGSAEM